MFTLSYSQNDLFSNGTLRKFDDLLLSTWLEAMKNGLFKYKIDQSSRKIRFIYYNGCKIILQLNTLRFTEKRKAEILDKLNVPYNSEKFNFNKIDSREILFKLESDVEKQNSSTLVIINNSPIDVGHVLLVPNCQLNLNQIATLDSIRVATEVQLLSNSNKLLIGFNSLCALASVNHLHYHAYYLPNEEDFDLPIQCLKAKRLNNFLWLFDSFLVSAVALQLSDFGENLFEFSKIIHQVTSYFSRNEIAHNLVLVRGHNFNSNSQEITVRAFVWPRKSYTGAKDDDNSTKFHLAICELSGHIVIKDEEIFNSLTFESITEEAKKVALEAKVLKKLLFDLENLS